MYQVLARKWRSANFDELVGQKHVTRTLVNAIESDRLAHAYIFAGLRGTGKTSVARILAKCLNCKSGPTAKPCDECEACTEVAASRALDVLEIDAASRTKVEQTRELLELVSYAPVRDRYKILIIDEAHMLSKASFNALLKTLEEPPPNVMFVLATTELGKLLPTILSRCQVFEFRRVPTRELVEHLRKICDAEQIEISDAGLERIARAGEGSVRDSLSVLERVLAFCGQQVDDEDLLRLLGGVRAEVLAQWLGGLAAHDAGAMLQVLDGLIDEGHDLLPFWSELIACVRDLLLMRQIKGHEDLLSRSPEESRTLAAATESMSVEDLTRAFQLLADLELGLRSSSQPRFLFETAMIRLAGLGAVQPIEDVLEALRGNAPAARRAPASRPASSAAPTPRARRGGPAAQKKNAEPPVVEPPAPAPATAAAEGPVAALIAAVQDYKPMVGAILEQAKQVLLEGQGLVISFDKEHAVFAERLREPKTIDLIRQIAEKTAGSTINIRVEIGNEGSAKSAPPAPTGQPASPPAVEPARSTAPAEEPQPSAAEEEEPPHPAAPEAHPPSSGSAASKQAAPPPPPRTVGRDQLLQQAKDEPGVKKLLREFGAQVVDIRPLEIRSPETPPDVEDPS